MTSNKRYEEWMNNPNIDSKTKEKMEKMSSEERDDAFYQDLSFGTAGLRGILGPGTNRMNEYTVGKATYALAKVIQQESEESSKKGVAIAYDVRHKSKEFAELSSSILCAMGIKVYLYDDIRTTPQLSYAVLNYKTQAGIMITASHNPKNYNGYKAYWEDGAQILSDIADKIENKFEEIDDFSIIKKMDLKEAKEKGLLEYIGREIDEKYYKDVLSISLRDDISKDIRIVYTPLNGTGNIPVREILKRRGFENIYIVKEQMNPDPDFTTVEYPNPEDERAFELAKKLGLRHNASVLIATDPDCDRTAIMVWDGEKYISLNGNQIGAVLIQYIAKALEEKKQLPKKGMIIKSIVTSDLGKKIASKYGIETFDTLTGFKNICNLALKKEKEGYKFLFGYEESIGYTAGTFVRDKDAVISSMLIAEASAFYMKRNKTLYDVISDIYKEFGFYTQNNFSIMLKGQEGKEKISDIMNRLRSKPLRTIANKQVESIVDYQNSTRIYLNSGEKEEVKIPSSNVITYECEDNFWFSIRPSGTEPKIKIYIYGEGNELVVNAKEEINKIIEEI